MKAMGFQKENKLFKIGARYVAGVDEVGRGALAGPLCVCAALIDKNILKDKKIFKGIRDSKKLNPKKRERFFSVAKKSKGVLDISIVYASNKEIDKKGIARALSDLTELAIAKLKQKPDFIFFDGGLKTKKDIPQKTVIKGDDKIFSVALASVCAKVSRDSLMCRMHKKHSCYGFDEHKGYGTKKHYDAIKKNGISRLHRKSYLRNLSTK